MVPISRILNLNCHLPVPFLPETPKIMRDNEVTDKHGNVIDRGDYVSTKIRSGTHEGRVSKRQLMDNPLSKSSSHNMFRWKR